MSLPQTVPPEGVEDTPIASMPAGTVLGNYELWRLLGRGGMGAVYAGRHRGVNKPVAIKILLPHLAANKASQQRFLREAEAAGRVRHPHTVDVTDVGVSDGIPYIVMELLEGENLATRLERVGPLALDAAVDLTLPLCSALSSAHEGGVVHRDLKPENIFLARTPLGHDVVKVLDFGISHIAQSGQEVRLTATNSVIGTPRYMSPEQTRGARNADARSDQYSVGVMLYQCLTGSLPYDGESFIEILEKMANKKVAPPSAFRADVPSGLDALVMKTLARDQNKRFASMRELGVALLPFASPRAKLVWEPVFTATGRAPSQAHALELRRDTTVNLRAAPPRISRVVVVLALTVAAIVGAASGWHVLAASSAQPSLDPPATLTASSATTHATATSTTTAATSPTVPAATPTTAATGATATTATGTSTGAVASPTTPPPIERGTGEVAGSRSGAIDPSLRRVTRRPPPDAGSVSTDLSVEEPRTSPHPVATATEGPIEPPMQRPIERETVGANGAAILH